MTRKSVCCCFPLCLGAVVSGHGSRVRFYSALAKKTSFLLFSSEEKKKASSMKDTVLGFAKRKRRGKERNLTYIVVCEKEREKKLPAFLTAVEDFKKAQGRFVCENCAFYLLTR